MDEKHAAGGSLVGLCWILFFFLLLILYMLNLQSVYTPRRSFIQMSASFVLGPALGVMDIAPQVPALTEAEPKLCLSGSNDYDRCRKYGKQRMVGERSCV